MQIYQKACMSNVPHSEQRPTTLTICTTKDSTARPRSSSQLSCGHASVASRHSTLIWSASFSCTMTCDGRLSLCLGARVSPIQLMEPETVAYLGTTPKGSRRRFPAATTQLYRYILWLVHHLGSIVFPDTIGCLLRYLLRPQWRSWSSRGRALLQPKGGGGGRPLEEVSRYPGSRVLSSSSFCSRE